MPKGGAVDRTVERIRRTEGVSLGTAIARAKHRKLVKQAGKHLKSTARGRKAIRKRRRRS